MLTLRELQRSTAQVYESEQLLVMHCAALANMEDEKKESHCWKKDCISHLSHEGSYKALWFDENSTEKTQSKLNIHLNPQTPWQNTVVLVSFCGDAFI